MRENGFLVVGPTINYSCPLCWIGGSAARLLNCCKSQQLSCCKLHVEEKRGRCCLIRTGWQGACKESAGLHKQRSYPCSSHSNLCDAFLDTYVANHHGQAEIPMCQSQLFFLYCLMSAVGLKEQRSLGFSPEFSRN